MKCSMTGRAIRDSSEGIWDDGDWISWDWINRELTDQQLRGEYPCASPQVALIFEDLLAAAREYKLETGRYLQIWGELGELYAEVKFGLVRHAPGTRGSDGRIGT